MSTPSRRSQRARKKTVDVYQVELDALAEKKATKTPTKNDDATSSDDDEDESVGEMELGESVPRDAEDEEDDYDSDAKPRRKSSPAKSATKKRGRPKGSRKTVTIRGGDNRKKTKTQSGKAPNNEYTRQVKSALTAMSKKVLEESESPENSLLAVLLNAAKPSPNSSSTTNLKRRLSTPRTIYTPQLEIAAKSLAKKHGETVTLHNILLNLIFRSVGGSFDNMLEEDADLEDMTDGEWDKLINCNVADMQETDADCTLLCTNPKGALDGAQSSKAASLALQEYRSIYEEFWFRLGDAILSGASSSGNNRRDDDDSDGDSDDDARPQASARFDIDLVRGLMARLTELAPVGQPDLRGAAAIAVFQLGLACLEHTFDLEAKLEVAKRQYSAASNTSRRAKDIRSNVDAWKRQKAELDEVVAAHAMGAVFFTRYRDSDPHIRRTCLESLSKCILLRPDTFLMDKFLKYFAWMCSDKDAGVRLAGISGLLEPFQIVEREKDTNVSKIKRPTSLKVDLSSMQNVCTKFLERITDCTEDAQSTEVQEVAMKLLRAMMDADFLDDWDDESGWDQVNLKALDVRTTPQVRKDALYFVFEQMEPFDTYEGAKSTDPVSEKEQFERVKSIAQWLAGRLSNGAIPIDKIRVHLTDFVVDSIRDMHEHKYLITNWSAILRAMQFDRPRRDTTNREEVTRQRILLRMLARAAEMEIGNGVDDDGKGSNKRRRASSGNGQPHETLSVVLLKSLPQLLEAFKGDLYALRSITTLPRYLIPAVFSLPSRKAEFNALIKGLCATFMDATDETVLQNLAFSLSRLVQGGHARVSEVRTAMKKLSVALRDRSMDLFSANGNKQSKDRNSSSPKRRSRTSDASKSSVSTTSEGVEAVDNEHSLRLCLQRLRILTKQCGVEQLFGEDEELEGFFNAVGEGIAQRLQDRKPFVDDDETSTVVPEIWTKCDPNVHAEVAHAVDEGLNLLLGITVWILFDVLNKPAAGRNDSSNTSDAEMEDTMDERSVMLLRLRDRLVKLVAMCFDQMLLEDEDIIYSDEHHEFVAVVLSSAGRVSSDVRSLFAREWKQAADPVRRSLALTEDTQLLGGFSGFLQSRYLELNELADRSKTSEAQEAKLVNDLILPLARTLSANWNDGNRREAGVALAHIAGCGELAGDAIQAMAKLLKKINPVRFLEAQMACLRLSFHKWLEFDPEDLESEKATEEELEAIEAKEKEQSALFKSIEQQAAKLSLMLGQGKVGKIKKKQLSEKMLGFMREGVRFAFEGEEGDFLLGSCLPFLLLLVKYANWVKRDKQLQQVMEETLDKRESDLRSHPEFSDVHEEDLLAISKFRDSLGIGPSIFTSGSPQIKDEDMSVEDDLSATNASQVVTPASTKSGRRRRMSTASSQRSRLSAQSSLSPLMEEKSGSSGESEDEEESPVLSKRRKLSYTRRGESIGSNTTMSAVGGVHERIEEEGSEGSGSE